MWRDGFSTQLTVIAAPVIGQVGLKYHQQPFNGSLLKQNIFRQDASPEVDAAWESLGANCIINPPPAACSHILTRPQSERSGSPSRMPRNPAWRRTRSRSGRNMAGDIPPTWRAFIICTAWYVWECTAVTAVELTRTEPPPPISVLQLRLLPQPRHRCLHQR